MFADVVPFGPGEQATLIAPHLRNQFDIDFFSLTKRHLNTSRVENGDHWFEYELGQRNWLGAARQLGLLLRRREYALVHTWDRQSTRLTKWVMFAAGRWARRAAWVRQAFDESSSGPKSITGLIQRMREPDWMLGDPWLLESAQAADKSTAIRLAVPSPSPKNMALRTARQLPADVKLIGTVCQLDSRSGLKHLIWALDQIKCVRDDLRLIVWGSGSQKEQFRWYARQIDILDWIDWRSPRSDVRAEMTGLDMYWHAPRTEATPPELVAALTSGLPAIAPRTAATAELAQTWSTTLAMVSWGARDEIARQTQQWLQHGWPFLDQSVAAKWTQAHAPAVVAKEYALTYERLIF